MSNEQIKEILNAYIDPMLPRENFKSAVGELLRMSKKAYENSTSDPDGYNGGWEDSEKYILTQIFNAL
jgi:hypothetical protein